MLVSGWALPPTLKLAGLKVSGDCPVSACLLAPRVSAWITETCSYGWHGVSSGDSNSGPHACTAIVLSSELAPQLSLQMLMQGVLGLIISHDSRPQFPHL